MAESPLLLLGGAAATLLKVCQPFFYVPGGASIAVTLNWLHALKDEMLVSSVLIIITRRVPVQWAVERDEIPYPNKVHDTTLRPILNITIKSTIVVRRDNSRIKIGCKHCNCDDAKFFLI